MGESAACQQLRAELVAFGFVNLGICGDVRHCGGGQSPCSGGGSSDHCHGNAFDAGNNGIDRDTRYAVIDHILHDGRCTYCIHEGKGQRSYHRGGTYFDSSGHGDHFHTSVHSDSRRNDGSPWGIANVTAGGGGGIVEVPAGPPPDPRTRNNTQTMESALGSSAKFVQVEYHNPGGQSGGNWRDFVPGEMATFEVIDGVIYEYAYINAHRGSKSTRINYTFPPQGGDPSFDECAAWTFNTGKPNEELHLAGIWKREGAPRHLAHWYHAPGVGWHYQPFRRG